MLSLWEEAGRLPVVAERPYEELLLTYRGGGENLSEAERRFVELQSSHQGFSKSVTFSPHMRLRSII